MFYQPVPLEDGDQWMPTQVDRGNSAGDLETPREPVEPTIRKEDGTQKNLSRPKEASGIPPVRPSARDRKRPDRLE